MREKSLKKVFCKLTAAVMCISLLTPAVPLQAAYDTAERDAVEAAPVPGTEASGQYDSIDGLSGDILYDTAGNRVKACGGEVHQFTENGETKWYWFGVDDLEKAEGEEKDEGIHLYSSTDLYNWDYEGKMWDLADAAHPKVLYNKTTEKYVMWVSVSVKETETQMVTNHTYVGESESIKGPFKKVREFAGSSATGSTETIYINSFINLYEEKQGEAYIFFDGRIAKLTADYKNIDSALSGSTAVPMNPEGGVFKRKGKYYLVNAGMPQYAVADSLTGAWTTKSLQMWDGTNYKPIESKNQTSDVFHVKTDNTDVYVCVGDSVDGSVEDTKRSVRYIWLPIEFLSDGTLVLQEMSDWKLDGVGLDEPVEPVIYDSIFGFADQTLYDTQGAKVSACGGEVHQTNEGGVTKWYWFGEDVPSASVSGEVRGLHLYSSTDLYNWKREEDIFRGMASKEQFETDAYFADLYGDLSESEKDEVFECLKDCPTAHPKVLYNDKNQEYVMWVSVPGQAPNYTGKECIATSKSIRGPFKIVGFCESMSGFVMTHKDSDGSAYIFYQGGTGLSMAKLTEDYRGIEPETVQNVNFSNGQLPYFEGAIFQQNGNYYMVSSGSKTYAVADSIDGTWEVHSLQLYDKDGNTSEIGANEGTSMNPTSCILKVNTEDGETCIHISDYWDNMGTAPEKVRYIWLPVKFFEDGTIALEEVSNWKLNLEKQNIEVTEVRLAETEKTLNIGDTYHIQATVLPAEATDATLTYASSDDTVASVSASGTITAKKAGTATITVASVNGKTAQLQLTVEKPEEDPVEVIEVKLAETEKTLNIGDTYPIQASVLPENAADKTLTYTSSDNEVAEVSATGTITAKKKGTATITVTSVNKKTAQLQVTVEESEEDPVEVIEVKLAEIEKTLNIGDTYPIQASVLPENAADKTLAYTSSDNEVASVSASGTVTAKKEGTATITVASVNGKTAQLQLTVEKPEEDPVEVTEVKLAETAKILNIGDTYPIQASVLPENAADKTLTYTSSDNEVAEVSASGTVTAKKEGTATITVASVNGKTAQLQLTVEKPEEDPVEVTEVKLAETSKRLNIGDTYPIQASVLPENATDKKLTYTSSDNEVAEVSASGTVTAKKEGTATITVASVNGKTAQLQLTVEKPEEDPVEVTEVKLAETAKILNIGDTYPIQATVLPENAADKKLVYTSSDNTVAEVSATGTVTAKKAGTAIITAASVNGKTAQLQITVEKPPVVVQKVLVSVKNMTVGVGEKVQLEAAVYPENSVNKNLTYKASNNKVKVDKKGKLTAKKTGTCRITISSSNGKKAVVKVTVKKKPGKISLNAQKKKLKAGKKFQIKAKLPKGTASYKLTYTSSKKSVAAVSKTGKITAKKKGNAVITVKTYNGKKASLKLTVK